MYFGGEVDPSSGVIIIEDMILKIQLRIWAKMNRFGMRRLVDSGSRVSHLTCFRRLCPLMESPPVVTDSDLEELWTYGTGEYFKVTL